MIRFLLIVIAVLGSTAAIAVLSARAQSKRAKAAEKQYGELREAFGKVKEKAELLQKTLDTIAEIEGEANAERKELSKTPDGALADRANALFN
jgi:type II secretory pathway pseudopilin PulG